MTLLELMGAASQRRLIAVNKRAGQDLLTICGAIARCAGLDVDGMARAELSARRECPLPAHAE